MPLLVLVLGVLFFILAFAIHLRADATTERELSRHEGIEQRLRDLHALAAALESGPATASVPRTDIAEALRAMAIRPGVALDEDVIRAWREDGRPGPLVAALRREQRAALGELALQVERRQPAAQRGSYSGALALAATAVPMLGLVLLFARKFRTERAGRQRSDDAIRTVESLLETAPLAFVVWRRRAGVVLWSDAAQRMFGLERAGVLGRPMPDALQGLARDVESALAGGEAVVSLPVDLARLARGRMQLAVSASRMPAADDGDTTFAAVIEDATPRRLQEQRRLDDVRTQRDALVREVHHRIKNHLQGVAGLLRQHLADKPLMQPLLEAATAQILSIAAVHGLQGELPGSALDLRGMVSRIAASISGIMHVPIVLGEQCAMLAGLNLVEEEAVPVAMVLNEMLMNAVKHRQRGDSDALVRVEARRDGESVTIMVSNPGFLPPRLNLALGAQLGTGLSLAKSLVPHTGAQLTLAEDGDSVLASLTLWPPHVVAVPPRNGAAA